MRILMPRLQEIAGFSAYRLGFYGEFHRVIAAALQELGHEAVTFSFARQEERTQSEAQSLHRVLSSGAVAGCLDICCWGYGLSLFELHLQDGSQAPIYDLYDLPYVGLLLDHPYNQAINGIVARRLHAAFPDRTHLQQLRLAFPTLSLQGALFAPPAVDPTNDFSSSGEPEREIDVLYVGTLTLPALERFWRNPSNGYWHASYDAAVCDAIADGALAAPERGFHLVVDEIVSPLRTRTPTLDVRAQMRAVEMHLRSRYRYEAVLALARAGVRMHVVGGGWESLDLPASVTHVPGVDYGDMYRMAANAKICLDASTYLEGVNDRVFNYLLNGAACFTNAAGYLREEFTADSGVRFYSMLELASLGDRVRELLSSTGTRQAAVELGRDRVLSAHTWKHRLPSILGMMRP